MQLNKLVRILAIAWTIIIFIGCALPGDATPDVITVSDKFKHMAIFALWAFLWRKASNLSYVSLFVIGTLYGFAIEIYQLVMPINRAFEWLDLVADAVGTLAGLVFSMWAWPLLERMGLVKP
ncbi:VanZ family protein [Tellurirhabdus bombi]|uniref:VanZ family protein n=1 Tax=Tellurirhabdus bombi TaxID=2907205 RepID=UPI001F348AFB|nr:VanZ family protein [Tellurirhabdus bombi]